MTSLPPQGTHFSDGVRVGPIFKSYSNSLVVAGVATYNQQLGGPTDSQPPGVYLTPTSLLDTTPLSPSASVIATTQRPLAAGYLVLVSTSSAAAVVTNYVTTAQGTVSGVLQLDVPRNISITSNGNDSNKTFLVYGWDQYNQPMVEQITGPNATTVYGVKAFMFVRAIRISAASTGLAVTVGTGNTYGVPYLVTDPGYIFVPQWLNRPDLTTQSAATLTTDGATTAVIVTMPTAITGLQNGDYITIVGASGTLGGISAANLNQANTAISSVTSNITTNTTTFTYVAGGASNTGTNPTGTATVLLPREITGAFVAGDMRTATATTGDVRGTYTPTSATTTITVTNDRLTIDAYSASGDIRKFQAAKQGSRYLSANPLVGNGSTGVVTVTAPGHQFITGDTVTISGATGLTGISAAQLNISGAVTVLNASQFTYSTAGTSGSTNAGGGTAVVMSPAYGGLYQTAIGRFGVVQYTQDLL